MQTILNELLTLLGSVPSGVYWAMGIIALVSILAMATMAILVIRKLRKGSGEKIVIFLDNLGKKAYEFSKEKITLDSNIVEVSTVEKLV